MSEDERFKILIVDDDEVVLATTSALLTAAGYEVTTHAGPFGACVAVMKLEPDLVLIDLNMPGLSGSSLAELIRRESWAKPVRIFFFSSTDDAKMQALVEETGADGYIRKGDGIELRDKVANALGA